MFFNNYLGLIFLDCGKFLFCTRSLFWFSLFLNWPNSFFFLTLGTLGKASHLDADLSLFLLKILLLVVLIMNLLLVLLSEQPFLLFRDTLFLIKLKNNFLMKRNNDTFLQVKNFYLFPSGIIIIIKN